MKRQHGCSLSARIPLEGTVSTLRGLLSQMGDQQPGFASPCGTQLWQVNSVRSQMPASARMTGARSTSGYFSCQRQDYVTVLALQTADTPSMSAGLSG